MVICCIFEVLVVEAPPEKPAPHVEPVEPERNALSRDRYVDKLHAMAELVWADFCREDER